MVDDGVYKVKDGVGYDVYFRGKYVGWARTSNEASKTYRNWEEAEFRRTQKQETETKDRVEKMTDDTQGAKEDTGQNDNKGQASSRGGSPIYMPSITLEHLNTGGFWRWVIVIFIFLLGAYYFNLFRLRDFLLTFGVTIVGLITVIFLICFIIYGWITGRGDIAKRYIATALFIWMLDLVPENAWLIGQYIGPAYQGFEFPIRDISGALDLVLLPVLASSATFAFLYMNMVYQIIKKEHIAYYLSFIFIIIFDYLTNQLPTYLQFSFAFPWGKLLFIIVLIGFGVLAWKFDKKRGESVPDFFSSLYMIFVFSFFWINVGWQGNLRAWLHVFFILHFGFRYIKLKEMNSPIAWHLLFPTLLIIDFFGYGLLWSSDMLVLQFIPPLVIFVIWYCYIKESNEVGGEKKLTYPVSAFILLATFILIMSVSVSGIVGENQLPFVERKGVSYKDVFTQFKEQLTGMIEGNLELATGGYYRGNVEKNRYESLGVYFENIRAADPRFYQDETMTIWGSIRSKTYRDAVIINFSCYRWKDSKRIMAEKIIPSIKFPIFSLDNVDTECTFFGSKGKPIPTGSNIITFSAEYNFGTDAYLKTYFIDRERFRAYARENIDPLKEFGIKDMNPTGVFTNGPVEIGMSVGQPPITVSEGYTIKPSIGITLTNRKEIEDKNKRIITRWEGKIKNITELILLVPPGITLPEIEKCQSTNVEERQRCPCSMPFKSYTRDECTTSCSVHILQPCNKACIDSNSVESEQKKCIDECETAYNRCTEECNFLFQVNEGEGPTNQKYTGYALDVGSIQFRDLNKDIDKHRSFSCRFDPSSKVLDTTPITTRYFRVRARYNYLLENSIAVSVDVPIVQVPDRVPDVITTTATEIKPGHPLWFDGLTLDLISAIALRESGWKHCCAESGKNNLKTCQPTQETSCGKDRVLQSYAASKKGDYSYGIMQVNSMHEGLASSVCKPGQTIYDKECNILVGVKILGGYYYQHRNKIDPKLLASICPPDKQPERYRKYSEYTGIKAALRAYNGLGCRPEQGCQTACANSKTPTTCVNNCVDGTINYVEKIWETSGKIRDGEIIDKSNIGSILTNEDMQIIRVEDVTFTPNQLAPISTNIEPPSFVQPSNEEPGIVTIRWGKSQSNGIDGYTVTRGEEWAPPIDVCGWISAAANQDTYSCKDEKGGLISGKKYSYTVIVYDPYGQYADKSADVTITSS